MLVSVDFKVFQNPAVQLVNVFYTGFVHKNGSLFAADAAGAKTHHGLACQLVTVVKQRLRELGELAQAPVDRIVKRARSNLKIVAGVQHDHAPARIVMAAVQPTFEGGSVNRRSTASGWLNRRVVHADDFRLDLDQQLVKRLSR